MAIVQARYSSQRFRGKVLCQLGSQAVLGHICDALANAGRLDGVMVATSTEHADDAIADYVEREKGIQCFRGSLHNVALRMVMAARSAGADVIVRVNGDSPLLDPVLVDRVVTQFHEKPVDLATNVFPRSFPKGQSVEVIAASALDRAISRMSEPSEYEHVTQHFYRHSNDFRITSLSAGVPRPEVQLSVDTAEDLACCESILKLLAMPAWKAGWMACVAAYDALSCGARDASAS